MTNNDALSLSQTLLATPSVTPDTSECLTLIAKRLENIGFVSEWLAFGEGDERVQNVICRHFGQSDKNAPIFCFVGHTDVVPVGDETAWRYPPFCPTIEDGKLYARGAADMKTAIACFVVAAERFIGANPNYKGQIWLMLTADEEGVAIYGIRYVVARLKERNERIDYCLVGEPSSSVSLGDTIKNGRRGSLNGELVVTGKQGHVAYPQLAINPIHALSGVLPVLCQTKWDSGNAYFLPTSFQLSNIHAGTGAHNVIPDTVKVSFNFRFCSESCPDELIQKTERIIAQGLAGTGASFAIDWALSGIPFLTEQGRLVSGVQDAIFAVMKKTAALSTSGGTSDGRFVATMQKTDGDPTEVVELGVLNASIHQVNEWVNVCELEQLTAIYERVLVNMLID